MDKLLAGIMIGFVCGFILTVLAVLYGTIVWFLWPVVAKAFGWPILSWWQSVCLTWICSFLFKNSPTATKKD